MKLRRYNFQGLNISIFSEAELNRFIEEILLRENSVIGYGYSLGIVPKMKKSPNLLNVTNEFDLLVTDGRVFYLYSKFFGSPLCFDISIPNLVFKTLAIADKKMLRVFFLGGTEIANSKAIKNVKNKYPNLNNVGGYHGYWGDEKKESVINLIKESSPDVVFLTLPSPEKELLAKELKCSSLGKFIIPCGGMVDVLAGDIKVSPRIIKKLGLAWFYRFIQEPKIRYLLILESLLALLQVTVRIIMDKLFYKKNDSYTKYINQ